MIKLIKYLTQDKPIKSVLQIDTIGKPLKEFFDMLHSIDPSIWSIVLTTKDLPRQANRNAYEIIYVSIVDYKPIIKVDLVIIPDTHLIQEVILGNLDLEKFGRSVLFPVPSKMERSYKDFIVPKFKFVKSFYFLHPRFAKLTMMLQEFLSAFKLFSDHKTTYLLVRL